MFLLSGATQAKKRENVWQTKRVFFITPQTLHNDLKMGIFPVNMIRLIVVDEAHHTRGKYSYVEVVQMIREKHEFFRILALSATPGKNVDEVIEVRDKLLHELQMFISSKSSYNPCLIILFFIRIYQLSDYKLFANKPS